MKLLADESVDRPIVERLRHEGHNVLYIAELAPSISDDEVLDLANDEMPCSFRPTTTLAN
jgi:hypothetical protein